MQDIVNNILQLLPANMDAIGLSLATGLATVLVFALKALFALAAKLAKKTPAAADDKIVEEAKAAFKEKSKDI